MNSRPVLLVSLIANAGLIGAVGYLAANRGPEATPAASAAKPGVTNTLRAESQPKTRTLVLTNTVAKSFNWETVESADYKEYIDNLRAIGCPEETIRDIIIADVNKLFEDRKKALKKPEEKFKFWETGMRGMLGGAMDEETLRMNQQLAAEKRTLLRTLLGIEIAEKPDLMATFNPFERMLDFLPAGKQSRIMELYQEMQVKQAGMFEGGAPDTEDMKKVQAAMKEMEAQIAGVLTAEEFDLYQLSMSQTAMMMRMNLTGFEPTEQEFREIFKAQKAFDDEFSLMGFNNDEDSRKKRQEAQDALNEQVKATLGEQRYAEYQRETDHQFKPLAKVAERQGLPKETAVQVWDMKAIAEAEANKVRANTSLSHEQRQETLRAIRAETERSMSAVLGDEGFNSYKRGGAWWLNGISHEQMAAPTQSVIAE